MPGPRHIDWRHTHVVGDRDAAQPYLKEAEKLLGFVTQEAARNGLQTYSLTRKLHDGAVITGEIRGGIPRITVVPPDVTAHEQKALDEGFYLSWGGSDDGWDPVMFIPPDAPEGDAAWRDWTAKFYSAESLGYANTPEDRRSGSYIGTFGPKPRERSRLLPTGGRWVDRETDEVVAWFRGYTGYWPEHYRHPRTNYSNWVTIFGHPVVALGSGWRVLAAAKRDGWLYMMIAEDLGVLTPAPVTGTPSYSGQVWFSQPYSNDTYTYALWRVSLAVETQPDTKVETYIADGNQAQMLWRGALQRAYGAWSFNADCSECVTVQLPRKAVWCQVYEVRGANWLPSSTQHESYPEVEAQRLAITIDHEGTTPVASFVATLAPDLIAEEDGVQLEIVEHTRPTGAGAYGRNDYRLGDFTIPITEQVNSGGVEWYERRVMVFAHLPSKTLLLHRWRTDLAPARYVSAGFQLFVDGQEIPVEDTNAVEQAFGAAVFDAASASNHLRTKGLLYDDGAGTSWWRPMDAMSFLLGFGFSTQGAQPTTGSPGAPGFGFQQAPHYGYVFTGADRTEHAGAGGYVFGSVGGSGSQFWSTTFDYARPYGANAGEFEDTAPADVPSVNYLGSAATYGDNFLAAVGLQPVLAVLPGGVDSPFSVIANRSRHLHFGTNGDAATVLAGAITASGGAPWRGFVLGHTGKPRRNQRGIFQWQ